MKKTVASTVPPGNKPAWKWQTGDYSPKADLQIIYPQPFLLLCKLLEVTPEQLIIDFIDNLSCSNWKRSGRDDAKSHLVNYFIEHGYGQHFYTKEDICSIFREMDAAGMVWPENGSMKLLELSAHWRNRYQKYWFKQWFRKTRRK